MIINSDFFSELVIPTAIKSLNNNIVALMKCLNKSKKHRITEIDDQSKIGIFFYISECFICHALMLHLVHDH